jgi:RimJ/RimL family protein N-acetyltransferase
MDVRIELGRRPADDESQARPFRPRDLESLRAIARASRPPTRFYADPHFPEERCDDFYERWLVESVGGWADAVLVADDAGSTIGYVTCHDDAAGGGSIGFIAVAAAARGRGLGSELVRGAIRWCSRRGLEEVRVATQAANVPAQHAFLASGFRPDTVGLWFHKWFDR